MSSLLIYLFIISLLPLAFAISRPMVYDRKKSTMVIRWNSIILTCFLMTILFRGIAYDTGTDWLDYCEFYQSLIRGSDTFWGEHVELGFRMVCTTLAQWQLPVFLLFTLFHSVTYYSLIKFSHLFYFCIPFILLIWYPFHFSMSCNIYRQYIAMGFFLLSNYYLLQKRYYYMAGAFAIGIAFHTITLIYIPIVAMVWWLYRRQDHINCYVLFCFVIVSHVLGFTMLSIIDEISSLMTMLFAVGNGNLYEFSSNSLTEGQYGATFTWYFLPVHLYWIWEGNKLIKDDRFPYFKYVYYFSIFYFIMFPISHEEFLMRVTLFFEVFLPFMLGTIYFANRTRKTKIRLVLFGTSLIPVVLLFLVNAMKLFKEHPYATVFSRGMF